MGNFDSCSDVFGMILLPLHDHHPALQTLLLRLLHAVLYFWSGAYNCNSLMLLSRLYPRLYVAAANLKLAHVLITRPLETSRFQEINATRCGHSSSCLSLQFTVYMILNTDNWAVYKIMYPPKPNYL